MEEEKKEGLLGKIDKLVDLNEQLLNRDKEKKWKLPGKGKVSNGQAKKNWTGVVYIRNNGRVSFVKRQIDGHTIKIDNYHSVTADEVLQDDKGKPIVVAAEWDDQVLNIKQAVEDAVKSKRTTFGQQVIFAQMKKDLIKPKSQINGKWIFIGLIVAGVVYWLFKSGRLGG